MTICVSYPSKKALRESIGKPLRYIETAVIGTEYRPNGMLVVAGRPHITGCKREFFANVTMKDGIIAGVK